MRWLAALAAALLAVPAAAQDKPAWVGVWKGSVGTSPVRLCIDVWGNGPARGAYYYLSALEPIQISEEDGEGGWVERATGDGPDALWNFTEQTGTRLRGVWRRVRVTHPFALEPVAWTDNEWQDGPCASAAFLEPRLAPGTIVTEQAELGGWRYTRRTWQPPAQFTDEVSVQSFAFTPEQPGDRAILDWLDARLPRGTMEDAATECVGHALSSVGADGYFEETWAPATVNRAFLTVLQSSSTYCGGAHPNHYTLDHTFDRVSGKPVDLFDWIGAPRSEDEVPALPAVLQALIVAGWPAESQADCRELAETTEYWTIGLAADGLAFLPDFPHVATACEEQVTVGWDALAPFLDAEGRAGLARLRGG